MGSEEERVFGRSAQGRDDTDVVGLDEVLDFDVTEPAPPREPGTRRRAVGLSLLACVALSLLFVASVLPAVGGTALSVKAATRYWEDLPTELPSQPLPQRSVILASDGSKIATFYSENRVLVSLDDVPDHLVDALVATEDSRFYEHHGVDVQGVARAFVSNAFSGSTQGGSTITQQYVKQLLLDAATTKRERAEITSQTSYVRKIKEARYATALEDQLSKDQILEGYLNIAYFGDGAYGIGAAALHYFDRRVNDLTLAQSALLVGLVKNPTGYDPTDHLGAATARRDVVLGRMLAVGAIDQEEYDAAVRRRVRLQLTTPSNGCIASRYPFFCQWIKQQLEQDPVFGKTPEARQRRLFRGGMVIRTSLQPEAQKAAQAAVDDALGRDNRVAAAAVTVRPGTGEVVAMATNRDFGSGPGATELLLPVLPAYQPGSNMKPFTLTAALEQGYDLSTIYDAPSVYAPEGFKYPGTGFTNSGSGEAGPMDAATALWRSSNTWYVHLETEVGVLDVADLATRLGITSLPRSGPRAITEQDASLTLGTYEVSPLEMAGAYATFAAHGIHCDPIGITSITGPEGAVKVPSPECHQAITAGIADTVASIMQGVIDGPDPARTGANQSLGRPAAGKTGTTQNNAAVWFSGYTPQFATSVWVGDPRGGFKYPLQDFYAYGQYISRAYGGVVAGPIWQRIMLALHQGLPVREFGLADPTAVNQVASVTPDVRGLDLAQAVAVLHASGLEVRLAPQTAPDDGIYPPDVVVSSEAAPGTVIDTARPVVLTMSAGSDLDVTIPRVPDLDDPAVDGDPDGDGQVDQGGGVVSGTGG